MAKVYITDSLFASNDIEMNALKAHGHECVLIGTRDAAELARKGADADALIVQFAPINDQVLDAMPNLKVMSRYGIGVDNFDLDSARRHGVIACNCPGYCLEEVAEHTLAFMLAAARQMVAVSENTSDGKWTVPGKSQPIVALSGKTLGIIGFGAIAKETAKRAAAFNMKLIAYDPYLKASDAEKYGVEQVSLDQIWSRSDFITLHCPLTAENRHMINAETLAKTKKGVIIVNNGRGGLIDEKALLDALNSGQVGMAALDVLEQEPPPSDYALLKHPNVLVTPHIASVSEFSPGRLQEMAVAEIINVLDGNPPLHPVGGTEKKA